MKKKQNVGEGNLGAMLKAMYAPAVVEDELSEAVQKARNVLSRKNMWAVIYNAFETADRVAHESGADAKELAAYHKRIGGKMECSVCQNEAAMKTKRRK